MLIQMIENNQNYNAWAFTPNVEVTIESSVAYDVSLHDKKSSKISLSADLSSAHIAKSHNLAQNDVFYVFIKIDQLSQSKLYR